MTTSTYSLRVGAPSDASLLRDLRCEALLESPSAYGAQFSEIVTQPLTYWEKLLRQRHYVLACTSDEAVGMACVDRYDSEGTAGLGIFSMYVRAGFRGSTVAHDLISECKLFAQRCDQDSLYLDVVEGNDRAIAFYIREGFHLTGDVRPMAKDHSRNIKTMVCAL